MCFDHDSRPPIPPIEGGALEGREVTLTSGDGTRFSAATGRRTRSARVSSCCPMSAVSILLRGPRAPVRRARRRCDRDRLLRAYRRCRPARPRFDHTSHVTTATWPDESRLRSPAAYPPSADVRGGRSGCSPSGSASAAASFRRRDRGHRARGRHRLLRRPDGAIPQRQPGTGRRHGSDARAGAGPVRRRRRGDPAAHGRDVRDVARMRPTARAASRAPVPRTASSTGRPTSSSGRPRRLHGRRSSRSPARGRRPASDGRATVRRLGGPRQRPKTAPGETTRRPDQDERRYERELAEFELHRTDDLLARQQRYADRAWTPPAQGGERRADDE